MKKFKIITISLLILLLIFIGTTYKKHLQDNYYKNFFHVYRKIEKEDIIKKNISFEYVQIQDANPLTFKVLNRLYSKDHNDIFCYDNKMKNSDYATFKVQKKSYAKDKNNAYHNCNKIENNIDINSFQGLYYY